MMDRSFVEAVRDLAIDTTADVEIDGVKYWKKDQKPVLKPYFQPKTLGFKTLTGLVSYLLGKPDSRGTPSADPATPQIKPEAAYLHVEDFNKVVILGPPSGPQNERHRIAVADSPLAFGFPFGQYMTVEEMMIKLRTMFAPSDVLDEVVKLITTVDIDQGLQQGDDGISQTVVVKKGISGATKGAETQKGYYELAPRRTFDEVVPVKSLFLFRLKDGGEKGALAALFEAGGDDWRLASIQAVRDWLVDKLDAWTVLA